MCYEHQLALHRGATGIFGWTWPGSAALFDVHSDMARVVTAPPMRDFLLGGKPAQPDVVVVVGGRSAAAAAIVDAAYWVRGDRALVSVVNGGYEDIGGEEEAVAVALALPGGAAAAARVEEVVFGGLPWKLRGGRLVVDKLPAMSTSFVILKIRTTTTE